MPKRAANIASPTFSMYWDSVMDAEYNTDRVAAATVANTFGAVKVLRTLAHTPCMPTDRVAEETGARLKRCRDALELTQRELAIETGWTDKKPDRAQPNALSPSRIGNFEQGARRIGPEEAAILERVFRVPGPYFMGILDERETDVIAALRGLRPLTALGRTGS
jgi:transcriptional regulator with XRE-family HTH domain